MSNNETVETREQTEAKMEFYKGKLSDRQLRMVVAFMRGFLKG